MYLLKNPTIPGIVSDLFPRMVEEAVDYGILEQAIRSTAIKNGLEDVNGKLRMLQIIR